MDILSQATDSRQATPGQAEPAISRATVTVAQIMKLPLDQVLTGLDIQVIESSITDANFYGGVHIGNGGKITILTSPGRDPRITDTLVRYLTAKTFNLDVADLPAPFGVEYTDITEQARNAWIKAVSA
ncbi:hypothetical protein R2B67_26115 [Streptomyces cyaneofuscatus]|uniref:hypothetical protein n=1 Tax=Streptomyces cyaneofuscatus TaxID=66883 RepID=UPI002955CD60|nr:hypothetical protein [Streptomyces cyaneofuscatus]WOP11796.1 hypothetical protein R2B67_26115 [Streptomyces cyaneofuscatus]